MSEQDVTIGEIARTVKRIEEAIKPLATLSVRMDNAEDDISTLTAKVEAVQTKSIFLSGLISGGAAVVNFLFGKHG